MFEGSKYAYYGMYLVGFAIMMLVNLKTYRKYELTKKTAVVFTLITYAAGVYGASVMGNMYSSLIAKYGGTNSSVAIFGAVVFTPIFMTVASLISNKPWRKIMDLLAPGIFIILTCAKFGCFMAGCCVGRECSFGIYNPEYEVTLFPSQLFESITMCFVIAFCFWYGFRNKKFKSGSLYPVTAAVYSVTRFGWEFMRYYPNDEIRHIIFGLTFWQFWCLVTIVISVIWLLLLKSEQLLIIENKYEDFYLGIKTKLLDRTKKNIVHHNKNKKKYQKKK